MSERVTIKHKLHPQNRQHVLLKFTMILMSIVVITLFLPKQPRFRYEYEKGKVWMHENLISPYNFAILKTAAELDFDRNNILSTINPIYDHQAVIQEQNVQRFANELEEKWRAGGMDTLGGNFDQYKRIGTQILNDIYTKGVMALNNRYQQDRVDYNFNLVSGNVSKQLNSVNVFTIDRAWNFVEKALSAQRAIQEKVWFSNLLKDYIQINYLYNEAPCPLLKEWCNAEN
jgi:hypothetical protein